MQDQSNKKLAKDSAKKRIFLVEDDLDLAEVITNKLEMEGFSVLAADSVSASLFKLSNQKFDCILMDLKIKQGDSISIIESIKKDMYSTNYKTPIFIVSGFIDKKYLMLLSKSVQGILTKPFDMDVLIKKINSLIGTDSPEQDKSLTG